MAAAAAMPLPGNGRGQQHPTGTKGDARRPPSEKQAIDHTIDIDGQIDLTANSPEVSPRPSQPSSIGDRTPGRDDKCPRRASPASLSDSSVASADSYGASERTTSPPEAQGDLLSTAQMAFEHLQGLMQLSIVSMPFDYER